ERTDPPTFRHRLEGECHCGLEHGLVVVAADNGNGGLGTPEEVYRYVDESGELLFEVVRFPGKQFRQRRPDGNGGWLWKLGETRRVLYQLPQVLEARSSGATIYIVEGEKDVAAA